MFSRHSKPPVGTILDHAHPLSRGLVSCYLLGEGGARANDSSVSNMPGTLTNFGPYTSVGSHSGGQAINCDGTDDYVSCGTAGAASSAFTVSIWCNISGSGNRGLIAKCDSGFANANYYIRATGASGFTTAGSTYRELTVTFANAIVNDTWLNVVMTYDGATLSGYTQGVLRESAARAGAPDTTGSLAIGRPGAFAGQYCPGRFENARVYNRCLSQDEVSWLYREPYAGFMAENYIGAAIAASGVFTPYFYHQHIARAA